MTTKELQALVDRLAAHSVVLAEQQSTINQLLREGIAQTGIQVQAMLLASNNLIEGIRDHEQRLRRLEGEE